jgi:hypothetical protein
MGLVLHSYWDRCSPIIAGLLTLISSPPPTTPVQLKGQTEMIAAAQIVNFEF